MRVLFLAEGNKKGGAATWRRTIMKWLPRAGVEVGSIDVLTPQSLGQLGQVKAYDIVHGHHIAGSSLVFLCLAKLQRKKIVYTVHGDIAREQSSKYGLKRLFWLPLHRLVLNWADVVTFPSQYTKQCNQASFRITVPSLVIYNPVDAVTRRPVPSQGKPGYRILTITNFDYPQKAAGIRPLIAAVRKLRPRYPQLQLDILGGGHLLDEYRAASASDTIHFHGRQPAEAFWDQADIYVHASNLDNLPYAVIEALLAGKVTFASRVGGVPEILPPDFTFELTEAAILQKLTSFFDDRATYRSQTDHISRQQFDPQVVARQFIGTYQETTP